MKDKIAFLNRYLPELRQKILATTILEVNVKEETFDNIVTDLDLKIQSELIQVLSLEFPDTSFLSEESDDYTISEKMWVIDPVDGTKNLFRRNEDYAVSIAYYEHNEGVFGYVYDIAKDLLFLGIKGEGAWLNGEPIPMIVEKTLNQSVLDMNLKTLYSLSDKQGADFRRLNEQTFAHRSIGSAALSLCRIAIGLHDIYISSHLKFWDYAAAIVILEAVNGTCHLPFEPENPRDARSVVLIACTGENHYRQIMETVFGSKA
jgi:myo-inositol-1(or 4)-monophosphatase